MHSKWLHSARARFASTAVIVVALVALGGVTSASAADVAVTVTVLDSAQGGVYPNKSLTLESSGGPTYTVSTNGSGEFYTGTLPEGSYRLVPGGQYVPSAYFTLVAGQTTASVSITKPKIAGTIPASAGSGHTTVLVEVYGQWTNGPNYSYAQVASFVVGNADGSFAYLLQTGTGQYRLHFQTDASAPYLDTYVDPITVDGTIDTVSIGAVALTAAGSITGTVTASPGGAAISGATVSAFSGATLVKTAVTAPDGSYLLKLAASDANLSVSAAAPGYSSGSSASNPVVLNAANSYTAASIGVSLARLPIDLTGNAVGGGGDPYTVDTFLYKKNGSGQYAQTPYGSALDSSSFSFTDLPDGDYRIAFRSNETDRTLVWSTLSDNGSTQSAPSSYGLCYYGFTVSPSTGSRVFSNVTLAEEQLYPASCAAPAYSDGSDVNVTGTITNIADLTSIVYAKLYQVGPSGGTVVDTSQVEANGNYSLSGARDAGDYYIKFVPHVNDPYLTALLGDGGETEWAKDAQTELDFADAFAFAINPATSSGYTGHNVTLERGARLDGYIQSVSNPSIGATLTIADSTHPGDTIQVPVDYYGGFSVVLPVGGEYTLLAATADGEYAPQYWDEAANLGAATVIGPLTAGNFGSYAFILDLAPPVLHGYISDVAQSAPITVHLYKKDGYGLWQPVESRNTASEEVEFSGIDPGNFRMRFERNGQWLSVENYRTGTLPDSGGASTTASSCFVDFTGVAAGLPSFIQATINSNVQNAGCAAEPPTKGDVTGHFVASTAAGGGNIANADIYIVNNDSYEYIDAVTDANGYFSVADVPNGNYYVGLQSPSGAHVNGTHVYYFSEEYDFAGGQDLGDLVAHRAGNVSGDIVNWDDATMGGAMATVYAYCTCSSSWENVSDPVDIDSNGHFEIPGIYDDGQYSVFINFGGTYVDSFIGGGTVEPTAPFTGTAELDYAYPNATLDIVEMVTISGTAFYGTFPLEDADIYAEAPDGSYYYASVDEDGNYELEVPPNTDYVISAYYEPLMVQFYGGGNYEANDQGPHTSSAVPVAADAVTDINFSLIASQNDYFQVYSQADAGYGPYGLSGVDVHLYQYVVDGWVEVDSSNTNYADLASSGGGDYRLRFEQNGEWLRVDQTNWDNDLPPFDSTGGFVDVDACYLEFNDLHHGSELQIDALLDADASASGCGPEVTVEHREVVGSTVQTDTFANAPIAGRNVTLTNTDTGYLFSTTSDAAGVFSFAGVSDGTYTLAVSGAIGPDGHAYVAAGQTVIVGADVALAPIKLTRLGNAELHIENWDASMAGSTARLQLEGPAGVWTPVGSSDVVDGSGDFVIPGITVTGNYRISVDYPTGFVDGFAVNGITPNSVLSLSAVAEYDAGPDSTYAFTTASGTARLGATAVAGATVKFEMQSGGFAFSAVTASNGTYSLQVPAGEDFTVTAVKTGLVRGIITTQTVGFAQKTGVNLTMSYATFLTRVWTGIVTLPTATVHLYRQVAGGWQEVATDTGGTTYLSTNVGGSYRIRISDGANWLSISDYLWDNTNNPADNSGGRQYPSPFACFFDFTPASAGGAYEISLRPDGSSAVDCGAEPAVVAPVTPGTSGSGTKNPVATFTTDSATAGEGDEPTSTPTPIPTASEDAADEPTDAAGVDKPDAASAPDLAWLFWVAGVLVLLLLAGGAVFFVRGRR